jgi:hypothetical protein
MSTTTKPKKKAASKPATRAKAAAPKKAKAAPPAETKVTGECAKGGDHEWTEEGDETFCSKCKEPKPAKATKKKAKAAAEPKERKLSAIDAAAQVLAASKEPMGCKELVEAMAAKGLWSSPGGKTPHATLYSAILREISVKGKESRFVKTDRGRFTASA